ncbi:MAG: NAD-dependent epimerase/dehydratase family protein [Deltaproteobacteria bacterium]|nr:NAD-dependent epimerase/dehydratase family protein [Deltaproteobacteria bacterium]
MKLHSKTIVITGANGFVGSHLCRYFTEQGANVRALVKQPERCRALSAHASGGMYRCQLPSDIDEKAFSGTVSLVVHCACEMKAGIRTANLEGTRRLLHLSQRADHFIFISSLAAHSEAHSLYGQSKWEIELEMQKANTTIIKPGTVIGNGGVFEKTRQLVRKSAILPLFYGGSRAIQTIWIGDLCRVIENLCLGNSKGTYVAADFPGVSVRDYYRGISLLENRHRWIVPFPGDFVLPFVQLFERWHLPLPLSSDNLLGLKHLRSFAASKVGVNCLSYAQSLAALATEEGNFSAARRLECLRSNSLK